MKDIVYYNNLYDCYFELLTEKQKKYFEDYYFNNLSLKEISNNYNVSRNAVYKQVKEVENKLKFYEEKLQIYNHQQKIVNLIKKIDDKKIKEELKELI